MCRLRSAPLWLVAAALSVCACCPQAGAQSRTRHAAQGASAGSEHAGTAPATVRAAATLGPRACYGALRRAGVDHRMLRRREAGAVAMPIQLDGTLHGVEFRAASGSATHEVVDCRLALALAQWARRLRDLGVTKVEHFSAYRPGARVRGSRKRSGHARALAVDAARFHLEDGRVLDVERDWGERERGGPPCPTRRSEPEDGELLRTAVCEAVAMGVFQVILTPHHDRAHHNHVHMELVPNADWTFIR